MPPSVLSRDVYTILFVKFFTGRPEPMSGNVDFIWVLFSGFKCRRISA